MKLPCEVAVKSVVPAIRALLAIELVETHNMRQREVADLLGITQTAISKYTHHVRGRVLAVGAEDEVMTLIIDTAASLVDGNMRGTALARRICTTCKLVREKRLMCKLCKRTNPNLDTAQCQLCSMSSCDQPSSANKRTR
jgi:predicted transcriptional regulator